MISGTDNVFSLLRSFHAGPGTHIFFWGKGVVFHGVKRRSMKLACHLHLARKFGVNGVISPLPTCLHGVDKDNLPLLLQADILDALTLGKSLCSFSDSVEHFTFWPT